MSSSNTSASIPANSQRPPPPRDDVAWIRNELIPSLARDGTFGVNGIAGSATRSRRRQADGKHVKRVDIEQLSLSETFMLTICYKIKVTLMLSGTQNARGVNDDDDDGDENDGEVVLQLVVKITPEVDAALLRICCFAELFHNEVTAYTRIFPQLGWSAEYPKFYYSHNRDDGAAIALSDFTADGWRLCADRVNLSLEHILAAVAELGKLHGSMYGLKLADPTAFAELCAPLKESRFVFDHTSEQWDRRLRIGPKRAVAAVRSAQQAAAAVPEWFLQRLEAMLEDTFRYHKRMAQRRIEPLAIVCHGDFLRNNIAFKYETTDASEDAEVPVRAMLFDFQTLRYASPALDLCTFMVNSTGRAVRRPHFERIFGAYHTALLQHFARVAHGRVAIPAYLGADSLLREYALYLPYGVSVGASFMPVLFEPDDTPFCEYAGRPADEEIADAWRRGGAALDAELCAHVEEMWQLYERFGLELTE